MKPTTMVRLWSLQNVFLLWLVRPKIVELSPERCVVKIPLNWITRRRDIHAMYLGTLCMGADVAAGLRDPVAQVRRHGHRAQSTDGRTTRGRPRDGATSGRTPR